MGKQNKWLLIIFGVVIAVFLFELLQLFIVGAQTGESFPDYSSHRAGPTGTKALYGALSSIDGIKVTRSIEDISKIKDGKDKTLVLAGANTYPDQENVIESLEEFIKSGGRLVITFFPVFKEPELPFFEMVDGQLKINKEEDEENNEDEEPSFPYEKKDDHSGGSGGGDVPNDQEKPEPGDKEEKAKEIIKELEEKMRIKMVSINERWGFKYSFKELPGDSVDGHIPAKASFQGGPEDFENDIKWHSAMYFDETSDEWRSIFERDEMTVIMERDMGLGKIVLASDSFFISNEALQKERDPEILAWLVGPSTHIIFDETHLGVQESPGLMTLIRKYNMGPILWALGFLSLIFIWKNMMSLVPKRPDDEETLDPETMGKDSGEGLVNLMRRSISSSDLIGVCVNEWRRAHKNDPKIIHLKEISSLLRQPDKTKAGGNPVILYKRINAILAKRGVKGGQ